MLSDLPCGPKNAIRNVTQHSSRRSEHDTAERRNGHDQHGPWPAGVQRRSGMGNQSGVRDRRRLLLYRLHITLEEIVVEISRCLGAAFKITKGNSRFVGGVGLTR